MLTKQKQAKEQRNIQYAKPLREWIDEVRKTRKPFAVAAAAAVLGVRERSVYRWAYEGQTMHPLMAVGIQTLIDRWRKEHSRPRRKRSLTNN